MHSFLKVGSLGETRLRCVKQVSRKTKDLNEVQVKNPHQRSPYAMKYEDWSHEETERQQRCARSKAWNLAKNIYKFRQKDKAAFYSPAEEWVLPVAEPKEPEEFVADSGASVHVVSKRDLDSAELEDHEDIKMSDDGDGQRRGANQRRSHGKCQTIGLVVKIMLLEETPAVLSVEKVCDDHGYTYHWTSGQKPHLIRNGKRIDCNISNYVSSVVPGLSTSSSTTPTPSFSTSSSQDSVFNVNRYTENPVPERSGSTSEELREKPLPERAKTKNTNKNEGDEEVQCDLLHDLPECLLEFEENLVDERNPSEPRGEPSPGHRDTSSSFHELSMESRAKVESGSGKHRVYTHFPKDPNCDICLETKITRASCRRRAGTVGPKAENFGDLKTADHKVLSEGCEPRIHHRYAVVVQDLASQWSQFYPCKTKSFPGDPEERSEVPGADKEAKSHSH